MPPSPRGKYSISPHPYQHLKKICTSDTPKQLHMEILPLIQKHKTTHFPSSFHHPKTSIDELKKPTQMSLQRTHQITKRTALKLAATSLFLLSREAICRDQTASAFDFRITTPEQTLEEAESGIQGHVQSLLQVKDLLKEESWRAAQKALRKSSAYLKQDIYTIIQAKPGSERSELRKMYSILFNSVSRLDYAARDKDVPLIWECYDNVVVALNNILQRI